MNKMVCMWSTLELIPALLLAITAFNWQRQKRATNLQGTVDNISFVSTTAVPEPTSVALLGMGGALMMIRRRR